MTATPWHRGLLCAFDTETTGVDTANDRIVTGCVAYLSDGQPVAVKTLLADPGMEIPEGAAAIHGITTEMARANGRPSVEVVEELAAQLASAANAGVPLVAYNAPFDLGIIDHECLRHGLPTLTARCSLAPVVLDPLVIDRLVDRYRKGSRKLTATCALYGVELTDAHRADADAIAAARVLGRMAQMHSWLTALPLPTLHAVLEAARKEQDVRFEAYRAKMRAREERELLASQAVSK